MAITVKQERVFEAIREEIPGVEFDVEQCSEIGNLAWITFKYVDPRPSRNLSVDDSVSGWLCVGPRGGFKSGKIWGCDRGFSDGGRDFSNFWLVLRCYRQYRHTFYQ